MRKIVGPLVALIGAFLVVVGILAQVYAPDKLMKTPIDSETTTDLSGTAQLSDGTELNEFPVLAWSITLGNVDKSDDDVAVFRDIELSGQGRGRDRRVRGRRGSAGPAAVGDHGRLRQRPGHRALCQRPQVPAGRGGAARGTDQQVALRGREEDLSLLGRSGRWRRRRGLRPHRVHRRTRDVRLPRLGEGRADRDRRRRIRHLQRREGHLGLLHHRIDRQAGRPPGATGGGRFARAHPRPGVHRRGGPDQDRRGQGGHRRAQPGPQHAPADRLRRGHPAPAHRPRADLPRAARHRRGRRAA